MQNPGLGYTLFRGSDGYDIDVVHTKFKSET